MGMKRECENVCRCGIVDSRWYMYEESSRESRIEGVERRPIVRRGEERRGEVGMGQGLKTSEIGKNGRREKMREGGNKQLS